MLSTCAALGRFKWISGSEQPPHPFWANSDQSSWVLELICSYDARYFGSKGYLWFGVHVGESFCLQDSDPLADPTCPPPRRESTQNAARIPKPTLVGPTKRCPSSATRPSIASASASTASCGTCNATPPPRPLTLPRSRYMLAGDQGLMFVPFFWLTWAVQSLTPRKFSLEGAQVRLKRTLVRAMPVTLWLLTAW